MDGRACAAGRRGIGTVALGSGQQRPCGVRTRDPRSLVYGFFLTTAGDMFFFFFFALFVCFVVVLK